MKVSNKVIFSALLASLMLSSTGCIASLNNSSDDSAIVIEDKLPLSFVAATDITSAQANTKTCVLNYLYYLSKGDYETALRLCNIPEGVVFDAVALQRCVLKDMIGRGESITFYDVTISEGTAIVVYELTNGGLSSEYTSEIPLVQDSLGNWAVSLDKEGYISYGKLVFQVPMYVDVYINDVYVPQTFMGNDYIYTIPTGIPNFGSGIQLKLDTNVGITQTYDLSFCGSLTKGKNSVNDAYYSNSKQMTVFGIAIPREVRESALAYIEDTVIPTLLDDLIHGRSWDSANVQGLFGEDSETDAMFSPYYKTQQSFAKSIDASGGKYYYYDLHAYDFTCSDDLASRRGYSNCVTDFNVLRLYVEYSYNYLYTKGSESTERNLQGSGRALVYLSKNENGEWYVHNLADKAFSLSQG